MLLSALILSCLSFCVWRVLLYGSQAQALCKRTKEVNKLLRRGRMDSISISTQAQALGAPRGMVEEGEKAHSKAALSQISLQQQLMLTLHLSLHITSFYCNTSIPAPGTAATQAPRTILGDHPAISSCSQITPNSACL